MVKHDEFNDFQGRHRDMVTRLRASGEGICVLAAPAELFLFEVSARTCSHRTNETTRSGLGGGYGEVCRQERLHLLLTKGRRAYSGRGTKFRFRCVVKPGEGICVLAAPAERGKAQWGRETKLRFTLFEQICWHKTHETKQLGLGGGYE